jgi:vacuolar iron transporter family protein
VTQTRPAPRTARRGRPPGTSARQLELIALRLFTERGFEETTVEQIAAAAGVSRRTFFRYFDSKAAALWRAFDGEVRALQAAFRAVAHDVPLMDAIRQVVVGVNHYRAEDVPELRTRMNLIGSVPALAASAASHYDAWERAVSEFAARRLGQPADSLYPLAIGRSTLAACHTAYDRWVARADADLTLYLDAALRGLAAGFGEASVAVEPPFVREKLKSFLSRTGTWCVSRSRSSAAALTKMRRMIRQVSEHNPDSGHAVRQAALAAGWSHRHRDVSGGWLRPTVFGAVDGLVTNASLIAGLGGGGASSHTVILTGAAALVAGAFSMGTGEYVSVTNQNELVHAEVATERTMHARFPDAEEAELADTFRGYGADPETAARMAAAVQRDPDTALRVHTREELGVDPFELPSPVAAGISSLIAFSAGALLPLLPYLAGLSVLGASLAVTAAALLVGGMVVGRLTGRPLLRSGLRQLALGAIAIGVTFAVGSLIGGHAG